MKLWKIDYKTICIREVRGAPFPGTDQEGDVCLPNTHFTTQSEALIKLSEGASLRVENAACRLAVAKKNMELWEREAAEAVQQFVKVHAYCENFESSEP